MFAVILYPDFSLHTERFVVKGVPGAYKLKISHLLECVCKYCVFLNIQSLSVCGILLRKDYVDDAFC